MLENNVQKPRLAEVVYTFKEASTHNTEDAVINEHLDGI